MAETVGCLIISVMNYDKFITLLSAEALGRVKGWGDTVILSTLKSEFACLKPRS